MGLTLSGTPFICIGEYWPKNRFPDRWADDPLTKMLTWNKKGNLQKGIIEKLSNLLYKNLEQKIELDNIEVIIPVPNFNGKLTRCAPPFAQALAAIIRKKRNRKNCHSYDDVLRRVDKTRMWWMKAPERRETVKNDYDVAEYIKTAENSVIKDHTVLLIDDIRTTGATSDFCADLLMQYGAKQVIILCIAQTHQ